MSKREMITKEQSNSGLLSIQLLIGPKTFIWVGWCEAEYCRASAVFLEAFFVSGKGIKCQSHPIHERIRPQQDTLRDSDTVETDI